MAGLTNRTSRGAGVANRCSFWFGSSAALAVGLFGSTGAWAQCTDNFAVGLFVPGGPFPAANALPLGTGSSVSALVSTINTVNTAFLTQTSAFVSAPSNPQPDQQGGGAWARTVAGTVDASSSSVSTIDLTKYPAGTPPVVGSLPSTGTQNCHTTTRQDYWGYQFGHDISILNAAGTGINWHFGVTGGYIEARTTDTTPGGTFFNPNFGTSFTTPPGDLSANTQVPFIGLYSAVTKGSFFADGQVRWDFYQNSIADANNGLFNQRLDARGLSVTGNLGYNIPLNNGWFIEPSGGIAWSRVQVDPLNVAGLPVFPAGGFRERGSLAIDDIESALGRASLRIGTNFTNGPVTWQPYFTASVFHEFAGDVTSKSSTSGNNFNFNPITGCTGVPCLNLDNIALTTSTSRVGTYGQFGLGTAAVLGNSGWLGYGRVDYRIGENIESWSVNAGLRYQFSPTPAGSIKDGPGRVVYGYNWTGPYLGAFGGAMRGDEDWFFTGAGTSVRPDFAGYVIGGQAGYNVQTGGHWVVGIEGDYGFSNARGGVSCPNLNLFTCNADVDRLAFLTGRLGVTWGRALFYAKAGLAVGEVAAGASDNANPPGIGREPSHWQAGWALGGGMEFALTNRWSAKAEYLHYDLGEKTFTTFVSDPGTKVDTQGDTVRVGVNYHLQREAAAPLK
jgi:opacity protein-like surface antigen